MRSVHVTPCALTLGSYTDALIAARVTEADARTWDALEAPAADVLEVANVLTIQNALPRRHFAQRLREVVAGLWADMLAAVDVAGVRADEVRHAHEIEVAESLEDDGSAGRGLLWTLSLLSPADRAAALAEPLARSFTLGELGRLARQVEEAERRLLDLARYARP